jgi:hypothetical protein
MLATSAASFQLFGLKLYDRNTITLPNRSYRKG